MGGIDILLVAKTGFGSKTLIFIGFHYQLASKRACMNYADHKSIDSY
jgi:hypothetical protein